MLMFKRIRTQQLFGRLPIAALVAPVAMLAVACGNDESTGPGGGGGTPADAEAYLSELPSWEEFAQPDTVLRDELDAEGDTLPVAETILDSVPVFADGGGIDSVLTDVRYVCQARPYSISDAPKEIVMFNPQRAIVYAGAMIQGRSKKELGSLLPLRPPHRREITVSIPKLATGENSRTVVPTQANVDGAWGDIIGNAVIADLSTGVETSFEMSSYHSESEYALRASISGHYLNFEGSASGSIDKSLAKNTVTATFIQRMYTVVVEPPEGGFFGDDFTQADLDKLVGDGLIGPDNLPVYISEVVYGRMMMFSVTSTATESEIRTAMQASYDTFAGGASGEVSGKNRSVLESSEITIYAIGGSGEAVANMIRTGNWAAYFEDEPLLSEAVPLSYTFTNVGDNSIAAVTEATKYNINECEPRPLVPGTFDFNAQQELSVPLSPGYQTYFGDIDGDDRQDMIFSYRSGSTHNLAVATADASGTYTVGGSEAATVTPAEGWSLFNKAAVGDVDGDGDDDIVFNKLDTQNSFYVALSDGDGTFTWSDRQDRGETGWGIYTPYVVDLDNDGSGDLLWNGHTTGTNRTYTAISAGDGTFDLSGGAQDQVGTNSWTDTEFFIADVTGDGYLDLIHTRSRDDNNVVWVSRSNHDGTFDMSDGAFTNYSQCCFGDYNPLVGDINNDQRADMFWIADGRSTIPIHRALGNANGTFTRLSWQHVPAEADSSGPYEVRMGDVDGDGDSDIILVDLNGDNNHPDPNTNGAKIWVGLGSVDVDLGTIFDFKPVDQVHPNQDVWGQYKVVATDVNGDDKTDLVLHWNSSPHRVYVALAK
ncbi:MAG: FG-GAP-like repeat-containing protein [Gemmatimonadota bacterium]|jgi:hypothetical protein